MKTFLLMLRLAFWTNPLQRVLTCLAAVYVLVEVPRKLWPMYIVIADFLRDENAGPGGKYRRTRLADHLQFTDLRDNSHWLVILIMAVSLLMAGVYWRIASAPRIVQLAPHGRTRMLGGVMGLVVLSTLVSLVIPGSMMLFWAFMGWDSTEQGLHIARILESRSQVAASSAALLASMAVTGLFVVSRSPLAALIVLIVLLLPTAGLDPGVLKFWLEFRDPSIFLLVVIWIPFSIWYLRARRIKPPGWLAGGSHDVLATTLVISAPPRTRSEALQRQLLGGTTIIRFGAQWSLILGFLFGLQWLIAGAGGTDPALSMRVMCASLCICPVVTTMVSFAAIRRSRTLWLLTSSTRPEFYASVERILIRLHVTMMLVFATWLAVLWFARLQGASLAEEQAAQAVFQVMGIWWLGLVAIYTQLAGWSRWPVAAIAAGALIYMWWLAEVPATTHMHEVAKNLTMAIALIAAPILGTALRWRAQRHWREGDFPRAATSPAS